MKTRNLILTMLMLAFTFGLSAQVTYTATHNETGYSETIEENIRIEYAIYGASMLGTDYMEFRERQYDNKTGKLQSEKIYIVLDEKDAFEQYVYVIGDFDSWAPVFEFTYDPFGGYVMYEFVEDGISIMAMGTAPNSISVTYER